MKKKICCVIFVIFFVIAFYLDISKSPMDKNIALFYIHTAEKLSIYKLYDASNFFYVVAQKTCKKTIWLDFNIAKNITNKYWGKALTKEKREQLEYALTLLDKEWRNHPNNISIQAQYAYIYDQLEDFDKAVEYYEKILTRDPKWEYGLQRLSYIYCSIKFDYETALKYINRKMDINIDTGYYGDYYGKAFILSHLDRYDEAIDYYKKYIKFNPTHVAGYVNIAICENEVGNYVEAEKYVNIGLKYAPNFSYLINSKIEVLLYKHKFEEAKKIIAQQIAQDKYDYAAYYKLANIYRYNGDVNEAEKYYQISQKNAQEYYDKYCENPYDINDYDGKCSNRYLFLKDFEKWKNKELKY